MSKKASRPANGYRGRRVSLLGLLVARLPSPPPPFPSGILVDPRDWDAAGTYLQHNVALPISRTRTCRENDPPAVWRKRRISRKRRITAMRHAANKRVPGTWSFPVHGTIGPEFHFVRPVIFSTARYAWTTRPMKLSLLYASFFFLEAASVGTEPAVCRLPVVPSYACVPLLEGSNYWERYVLSSI